jgi:serine/threonine-protein kinase RsbW
VEEISGVADEALSRLNAASFSEDDRFAIETALREALANAVLHGAKCDASKLIFGIFTCEPDGSVTIVVRDPGPGFDPNHVPDPLHRDNLSSDHGRGLYLIRQLMDEVHFAHGGREIQMQKHRHR